MAFGLNAKVQQLGAGLARDGADSPLFLNRERALQVNDRSALVDLWTRQGRVWTAGTPAPQTPETMSGAGTALTLTDPSLRFTVPAGALVVPIHVQIAPAQVTAKNDLFAVLATASDSFTSGGEAITPYNAIVSPDSANEYPSTVTNLLNSDTSIVETTLVRPRTLKIIRCEALADSAQPVEYEYNILKGDQMVYLVGPASFLVFLVQETTAAEASWSMSWAVLDAGSIGR